MIDKATETLEQMKMDQADLITQQDRLKSQQVTIQSSIAVTLRDLYKEKALIASGHKTFTEMTQALQEKLGNTYIDNMGLDLNSFRFEQYENLV